MTRNKKITTAVIASVVVFITGISLYINNASRKVGRNVDRQVVTEDETSEPLVEESSELPADFPEDFPIYPEAKIESAYTSKGDEVKAMSVVWLVRDSLVNVSAFYRREIRKAGWIVSSTFEDENSTTLSFEKAGEQGFMGIGKKDDGFVIISATIGASFQEPSL